MRLTRQLGFICIAALTLLFAIPLTAQESTTGGKNDKQPAFAFTLTDGSRLIGTLSIEELPVKTSYADVKIPIEKVAGVSFDKKDKAGQVSLSNGDKLKGEINLDSITASTLVGDINLPIKHLAKLQQNLKEPEPEIHDSPAARNACINRLRQIDAAKEQFALANGLRNGVPVPTQGIGAYIKGGWHAMKCPAGGKYTVNLLGTDPQCSVPGHQL